jgi:hypothetical protein
MTKNELRTLSGRFKVEHWRKGEKIGDHEFPNGITVEGKNRLLQNMFNSGAAITAWYLGLVDANGAVFNDTSDNYNGINRGGSWNEYNGYNAAGATTDRPAWTSNTASNKTVTNTSPVVFDINTATNQVVYGLFVAGGVAGANVKGNTSNSASACLWSTANFTAGNVTVQNGDQLKVTYTVST